MSIISDLLKSEKPCIFSEATGTSVILGPVTSESESGSIQITDNAVEDGTTVSDHINKDPESVDVTTFFADSNDLTAQVVDVVKSGIGFSVDRLTVSDKIALLKLWRDTGEIVTYSGPVFSGLLKKGYDITASSMVITKVDNSRSLETGSGLSVNISLRKIVIAEAMMKNSKLPTAAKKLTKKGQTPVKSETVKDVPKKTLFKKLLDLW